MSYIGATATTQTAPRIERSIPTLHQKNVAFVWGTPEGESQPRLYLPKWAAVGGVAVLWTGIFMLGRQSGKKAKK
jgi:hypothetical protein